jgi:hypothetical protein
MTDGSKSRVNSESRKQLAKHLDRFIGTAPIGSRNQPGQTYVNTDPRY